VTWFNVLAAARKTLANFFPQKRKATNQGNDNGLKQFSVYCFEFSDKPGSFFAGNCELKTENCF